MNPTQSPAAEPSLASGTSSPQSLANNAGHQPAPVPDSATLRAWFESVDEDGNGEISVKELQKALKLGNLNYSDTDVDAMVRAFTSRDLRTLNLAEFTGLHHFLNMVSRSFSYFDVDKSRSLDHREVCNALRQAGFQLDEAVQRKVVVTHDVDRTGKLELDEYIRMCLFLHNCARTFNVYDVQQKREITLNFDNFVYAATHLF